MDALLDEIFYKGPVRFQAARLVADENLFAMRAALFYTPTSRIPPEWIGHGSLDVWLPLAIPTIQEWIADRGSPCGCGSTFSKGPPGRFDGAQTCPPGCASFASTP
jgi:hypothetical protein